MLFALLLVSQSVPTVNDLMLNVRDAIGFERMEQAVGYEAGGTGSSSGLDVNVSFLFMLDGSYRFSTDGPLGQTRAWNGESGWETDSTGAPVTLALSELEHQHAVSWVLDNEWLDPNGPYDVSLAPASVAPDGYTLTLKQKGTIHVQTVLIDAQTWLPKETRFDANSMQVTYRIKSWQVKHGFKFPKSVETIEGGVSGFFEFADIKPVEERARSGIARPAWRDDLADQWRDSGGKIETRKVQSGHILVKPLINGKDVGWFILDSGAGGMVLDNGAVTSLGLKTFGTVNVGGVGGLLQSPFVTVDSFEIGSARLGPFNFIGLDLKMISLAFGTKIGGIVGYDFLRRAVVEMDLDAGTVGVYDPKTYSSARADWQKLVLDAKHPTFEAEFEGGRKGRFRLDTGADGTVAFNEPTVARYAMLEGKESKSLAIAGVGGAMKARGRELDYFVLAGKRFERISAVFATDKKGVFGSDYLAGNIGHGLLAPFTIVFDYKNERLALIPK